MKVINREKYWAAMEKKRWKGEEGYGRLPEGAFDFISVHSGFFEHVGLCAPLCMTNEKTGERPRWEDKNFSTIKRALLRAKRIAIVWNGRNERQVFVVLCPERKVA